MQSPQLLKRGGEALQIVLSRDAFDGKLVNPEIHCET
jgi:hypothetical protein